MNQETANWQTIGYDKALDTLTRSVQRGGIAHAWLLAGPPNVGKMTLALDIARLVNCQAPQPENRPCAQCRQCQRITNSLHADVRVISQDTGASGTPRRTAVSVDQIREIQREAILKPYEGNCRVFIIENADNFTQEAANALLKMLEEPPENVLFALLAAEVRENTADESAGYIAPPAEHEQDRIAALLEAVPQVGGILPTILSRCQTLQMRPLPTTIVQRELETRFSLPPEQTTEIARLSAGRLGWALQAAADPQTLQNRSDRLDEIEAVIGGALDEKFAYAERQAAAFGRSRQAVYHELQLWQGWWRDALIVHQDSADYLVNISRAPALQAAAAACAATQSVAAIRAVQETTAMLESNVNPRLCLEAMMLRMPPIQMPAPTTQPATA